MKLAVSCMSIALAVIYLPIAWFMSFLLYSHVHATELMWFLFWINIPFGIFSATLSIALAHLNKEKA